MSAKTKALIVALAVLAYAGPQGTRVAVSLEALQLGIAPSVVGFLSALSFILPMIVSIPAGRIVDRTGVRRPVFVLVALLLLAQALAWLWPSAWTLGFASAVAGICYVGFTVALNVGVMRMGTPDERVMVFSWFTVGISAGFAIGPMTAGFGIDAMGGSGVFVLLATYPIALAALMLWRGHLVPEQSVNEVRSPVRLLEAVSDRKFRPVLLVSFTNPTLTDMFNFIVPLMAKQAGLSGAVVGTILGSYSSSAFIARMVLPLFVQRVRHWVVVSNLFITAGIGMILFGLVVEPAYYVPLAIAIGMSHGMGQPLVMAEFVNRSPPGRQGEVMGAQQVAQGGISALAPIVIGAVGSAVGVGPVLVVAGSALLVVSQFARRMQGR